MERNLAFRLSPDRTISTELPAFIAGILNITPDSFCPVGRCGTDTADLAAEAALRLVEEGADLLDIGAESTRPLSVPVSEEEELSRLIPALKAIRKVTDCPISIDTTKATVMKAALDEGADMLNDVSALAHDKNMANVCSHAEIPVILMHNHDIISCTDADAAMLAAEHLAERTSYALRSGIAPEKIILDAGIGFGKTYEQNLRLIAGSRFIRERVLEMTGMKGDDLFPVMMALSRKSCIGMMTGRNVEDRLSGTLSANLLAVQEGASFLRVHDVAATRDMLKVLGAIQEKGENV